MIKLINIIKETKIIHGEKEIPNQYIDIIDKLIIYFLEDKYRFDLKEPVSHIITQDHVSETDKETIEKFNKFINQYSDGRTFLTNNLKMAHALTPAPGAPKSHYRCKITTFKNSIKVEIPYIDNNGQYYTGWFTSNGNYQGDIQNFDEDGDKI
jgi:hypothetical protein